jgi:hypothetical protein
VPIATIRTVSNIARARNTASVLIAGMAAAALLVGCGNRLDTAPLVPAAIVITTPSGTTAVTGTIQFSATVTDANGHTIAVTPAWSVVNGGGAITSDGLFTAGDSAGTFVNTIVATTGAVSSASTVTVTAGELASITMTPETVTVAIDATQQFTAVGTDAHGNVVSIAPVWSVVAGGGTIDSSSGRFTAGTTAGAFTGTVKATSGSIAGTASVTVTAGALSSITVTPPSSSLEIGAQQSYTAVGHDSHGNVVAITPTWSLVSGGGSISGSGVFTAGTVAGTFTNTVRASVGAGCGSIAGRASATVLAGPLANITVSPSTVTLAYGATQQYTAAGGDAYGNAVAITPVWSVVGSGGGTISSTGLLTAGTTAGTFNNSVQATVSTISGSASFVVTAPVSVLVSIEVTPGNPSMFGPSSQQFTATGYDASHNVVPIPGTLIWSVNTPGPIGSIDPTSGLFQFNGSYNGVISNAISVTNGVITGYASLTLDCGC